ncbi:MAG TPA: mycofactocin-coupled SDR family oxidoreductase, partial [Acidimicrobiales bacterium]|nr:mycofactocin-coupled SDR family oxidoreductase [Acidimicrobiales bacterium]
RSGNFPPMGRLDGKVAFITGAARGQGRAHAVRLANEGARIAGVDICAPLPVEYEPATSEDLAETVRLVEATGQSMLGLHGDVRRLADMQKAVAATLEAFGQIDVVVANAGILTAGLLWELSEEQWHDMIDTNLTGVWHTIKAVVPVMIEQGRGGSIIVISSVSGLSGSPFVGHYVAAKHGAVGLCRTLANELGAHRIRVNSVHPAGVTTKMNEGRALPDLINRFADTLGPIFMTSLPYFMMEPEAISNMVAFLASDESKYITGAQLPIDMGTLNR